jgi:hypothetical protein
MKKKESTVDRLERIIKPELDKLQKNVIMQEDNSYHAFSEYIITKQQDGTYIVNKGNRLIKIFSTSRYALSWCIADKYGQDKLANNIQYLDEEKIRIFADIQVRQMMSEKITDNERKEIIYIKILARKQGLKAVENRLTKCVSLAKYYQIRGFNRDETARTRRTQPTR